MNAHSPESLARAQQVDHICCRFEAAWQAGARPALEDYLSDVPSALRDVVLLELIPIEQHYRKQLNEPLDPDPYFRDFPHLKDRLDGYFAPATTKVEPGTDSFLASPSSPGSSPRIPGYEIEQKLGQGGMAIVYRARDSKLNRTVAIKMILGAEDATPEGRIRMRLEAEAIACLHHPNIVELHALHEIGGQPILVMGYVAGGTLHAMLRAKRPDIARAVEMLEALARGVHHAHQKGVIHRDLKPGNVLLDAEGTPKISDFGLAKRIDLKQSLTRTGVVLGTPGYMSPEQARGETDRVGTATDIHALGVMLYEMLAGKCPFEMGNVAATLKAVCEVTPALPSSVNAGVPRDLDTICMKCLRKQPEDRYGSALELAQDLRRFQEGRPIFARPVGIAETLFRWTRRNPAAAALIGILILGVAVIGFDLLTRHFEWERKNREVEGVIDSLERLADDAAKNPRDRYRLDDLRAESRRLLSPVAPLHPGVAGRAAALESRVTRLFEERELARRLEAVRFQQHLLNRWSQDNKVVEEVFRRGFEESLSFEENDLQVTADRIQNSPYSPEILGPLDDWAVLRYRVHGEDDALRDRLIRILTRADPDPDRVRIRRAIHSRDLQEAKQCAELAACETLPAPTLAQMASVLRANETIDDIPSLLLKAYRRNPGDFWLNYELSIGYLYRKNRPDLAEAKRFATGCLAINPGNAFVHQQLAFIATLNKEEEVATFHLGEALRLRPEHSLIHYHAGTILDKFGHSHAASEEYRKALACEPGTYHHRAWSNLAVCLSDLGDPKRAARAASAAIRLQPEFAAAYLNRMVARIQLGQFEEAFSDFQSAKRHQPEMEELGTNGVHLLIQIGELDEAVAFGKSKLKSAGQDPKLRLNLAAAMGMLGDRRGAEEQFRELTKLQPKYALAWYNLGESRMELGDYAGAEAAYRQADQLGKKLAKWAYPSAEAIQTARRCQELLTELSRVLDGSKRLTDADEMIDFAQICLAQGHPGKAVGFYRELFEKNRKFAANDDHRTAATIAAAQDPASHPQALIWLKEDLKRLQASDWRENRQTRLAVRRELQKWKQHWGFAPLRDEKLGPEFKRFWDEVDRLRQEVRERMLIRLAE